MDARDCVVNQPRFCKDGLAVLINLWHTDRANRCHTFDIERIFYQPLPLSCLSLSLSLSLVARW